MKLAPEKLLKALQEAERLQAANKLNKALQAARQAYRLALDYLPAGHPERRRAARVLGMVLTSLNQQPEAERLLRESGDLPADAARASQLDARNSEFLLRLHREGASVELLSLAASNVDFAAQHLELDSDEATTAQAHLGRLLEQMGEFGLAERAYSEVLNLRRTRGVEGHLMVWALLDLARIFLRMERLAKSGQMLKVALRLQQAQGEQTLTLAVTHHQCGKVCLQRGNPEEALEHLQQSLAVRRSLLGANHPEVAVAVYELASAYLELEDYPQVNETMEMAWSLSQRSLGEDHPQTLQFLAERGLHLMTSGARVSEGLQMVRMAHSLAENQPFEERVHEHLRLTRKSAEEIARNGAYQEEGRTFV